MRADETVVPGPGPVSENSRTSEAGAGWDCSPGSYLDRLPDPKRVRPFSWRHPKVWWRSRNDWVAKTFGDPSNGIRRRWAVSLRERDGASDLVVRRDATTFSFLLLGDTGEGDQSQYAVVPPALAVGAGTDFMVVCSDVIYPAGDAFEYGLKFFRPYRDYPAPIFAIPGNHDWYDGLRGFMWVFCDLAGEHEPEPWGGLFGWLARLLWRRPGPVDEVALDEARETYRGAPEQQSTQPASYWAIDYPALRIVAIDTGITGGIDRDQAAWLREVSAGSKPKLLITGKPLIVDNNPRPGPIEDEKKATVDEIVRDPEHHYVAAIGGDTHNYQRYRFDLDGREIDYIVSGGGGAFMHATHIIPKTTVVEEDVFRCYPLRGDSLSRYSKLYARWLHMKWLDVDPKQAAAVVADRLGMETTREDAREVTPTRRTRIVAALLGVPRFHRRRPRLLPAGKMPQRFRSEFADWDAPPFFKNFLRVDVTEDVLTIWVYGVSGCGGQEDQPPIEDKVTIKLR